MSFRRKILLKDAALLVGLLAMIGCCLWGLLRQRAHLQASLTELSIRHEVELAQAHLLAFQQGVRDGPITNPAALEHLRAASYNLRRYKALVSQYGVLLPPEITDVRQAALRDQTRLTVDNVVQVSLWMDPSLPRHPSPPSPAVVAARVDRLEREVVELLTMCNGFVQTTQGVSDDDLRTATIAVVAISAALLLGSIGASLWQHRQLVIPVDRLRRWCRRTAQGDFSEPYHPTGDREFQELAHDVNRMASDLNAFYRRLEAMVETKSRELVRSERLASIGYLAAGVAHEINTPLAVMSGYAELSLRRLARGNGSSDAAPGDGDLAKHLSIIRGEAFRCKQITEKLLCLARGSGAERSATDVAASIADVATMIRGLPVFRDKQLQIYTPASTPLLAWANATELRQVLLNLLVNAFEAVPAGTGQVCVVAREAGGFAEVVVSDNGRGMTEHVRERVFEPFFTEKRGQGETGNGLGLSVTHAIVNEHGGRIEAQSEGPGKGSRFIVCLPMAMDEAKETEP